VVRQGKVRRAKLYYLRSKKGKFAKVEDREFSAESRSQTSAPTVEEAAAANPAVAETVSAT
jgi:large subunit ribosomal protein L19